MFDGIVGQERTCSFLAKLCAEQSLNHAYLLVGPAHVGKATIARRFAAALLTHTGALTAHPDYCEIGVAEGDTTIAIESVRVLSAFIAQKPFVAKRKVAYVHHAEALQPLAADALLKTLEEPTGERVIVLTALHQEVLPATIRSRCHVIECGLVSDDAITAFLSAMYPEIDEATRLSAAVAALGRPGLAVRLLQDKEQWTKRIDFEQAVTALLQERTGARMRWLQKIFTPLRDTEAKRAQAEAVMGALERALHTLCRVEAGERIARYAQKQLADTRHALAHNVSPQLVIENLFITIYH
ncbi:hypothetical protein A3H75_03445 [Candidatus Uhrbacteria bacterium RIFCSPLOWO2_02_FULL_51_9]|uniref:DNA-directed DNA polymerase n=1 Tax=Candidatus Uhrbacteria bacterium RIFCSPLOWO2_02_FULL_51_9 TaxID=1802410 RepID=A0A1F7VCV3_9BACT|nr:MAG: hypothetical protein A3H75_03445 [Candidatus Uhrbacteria bacterium RIFCSPLOWO2_02_FULL_51_9]